VPWEHPGLAEGTVALGGCQQRFFPQTGGGIRLLLEARPEGHGCWGGRGSLPHPKPTELGVEIAVGQLGHVVLVQEVAPVALLAEPAQPVLAHHRLLPADVPEGARHAWPRHAPAVGACFCPAAPPAPPQHPPAEDMPAGAFMDVKVCSTHWVQGVQSPACCQALVAPEGFKPSLVQRGWEHPPKGLGE